MLQVSQQINLLKKINFCAIIIILMGGIFGLKLLFNKHQNVKINYEKCVQQLMKIQAFPYALTQKNKLILKHFIESSKMKLLDFGILLNQEGQLECQSTKTLLMNDHLLRQNVYQQLFENFEKMASWQSIQWHPGNLLNDFRSLSVENIDFVFFGLKPIIELLLTHSLTQCEVIHSDTHRMSVKILAKPVVMASLLNKIKNISNLFWLEKLEIKAVHDFKNDIFHKDLNWEWNLSFSWSMPL